MENTVGFYPTNMGSIPVGETSIWADSLMVKQSTHNRLSESSILSQPTNTLVDKLVKSALSKGAVLSVRIRPRVPDCVRV
jgi:hypothetical protein